MPSITASPTSHSQDTTGPEIDWTFGDVTTVNGAGHAYAPTTNTESEVAMMASPDFSGIPDNATIVGITASIRDRCFTVDSSVCTLQLAVATYNGGSGPFWTLESGTVLPTDGTSWSTRAFGSSTDMPATWSSGLTKAQAQNLEFWVYYNCDQLSAGTAVQIDYVDFTVHYVLPADTYYYYNPS